jgi:hypothetical protein
MSNMKNDDSIQEDNNQKRKCPTVEMSGDGYPKWDPDSARHLLLYKKLFVVSLMATFLAVVGTDLIILLLPHNVVDE